MSEVTVAQKKAAQSENTSKSELRALAEQHIDLARLVARNPSTSEALLRQLGSHEDSTVRKWVTGHPATPTNVLLSLGQQFPEQLLVNPILDFLFLENPNLLSDFPLSTIRALMKRRATPESILRFGAQTSDEATQLALVQNPSTPEDLLKNLNTKAASSKVKDAIKARRQAEPDASTADELFWEEVCARVAVYGPKKAERKLFESVCASAPAAAQSIDWLRRRGRANAASIPEEDLEAFAKERNPLVVMDLLTRKDLPVNLILRLIPLAPTESLLTLTKNKKQASAVLRALADNEEDKIRVAVAKHAATPETILVRMSADKAPGVRAAVAEHPQTPVSTLEAFAHEEPDKMLTTLAGNKNTPDRALRLLVQNAKFFWRNEAVIVQLCKRGLEIPYLMKVARNALAKNDNCPADVLKRLATDKDWTVRCNVAENSNTPAGVLKRLASGANDHVRDSVARNPNTPAAVLEQLSRDSEDSVRDSVAWNPNTPAAVLEQLSRDSEDSVRYSVARNPNTPAAVLESAGNSRASAAALRRLMKEKDPGQYTFVLEKVAGDKSEFVRRGIARNPSTPATVLSRLAADDDWRVRESLAGNPSTPATVLSRLAADDDRRVRRSLAGNPSTPATVLSRLAGDDDRWVREILAGNSNSPKSVLVLLSEDDEKEVRVGVGRNPNTPESVLELLARDNDPGVRGELCRNLNTPYSVLEQLVEDKHQWVRGQAARHPGAFMIFDEIMQRKTLKTGVFEGFMENPNIISKLEPYIRDFLRLLQGKEPLLGSVGDH